MAAKRISKNIIINLVNSLNIVDTRFLKSKPSKLDIYVLSKFSVMDYYRVLIENEDHIVMQRNEDFIINCTDKSINLRCFKDNSFFIIDKKTVNIFVVLTDIRMIICKGSNGNVCVKDDNFINQINDDLRKMQFNYGVNSKV